ncbi:MAG: hypothetical protein H6595_01095 [Flavobacteriales bacterium]|nr:hypothetical protein [Flavobacteriales bacterium]MCB9166054.1 hypothetical protein [Flavobacteriales bacterium]
MTSASLSACGRRILLAHARGVGSPTMVTPAGRSLALDNAAGAFRRAQDAGPDDGLGSYHLIDGWGPSYPETTGYIIPTLLDLAARPGGVDLAERADRAGRWLLGVQLPDGGWPGGRVGEGRPAVVFNTAQVVRGLLALYAYAKEQAYLDAAVRAGRWIVSVQEQDGSWRRHNFLSVGRTYDTYVDVPLLKLHAITGDARPRQAALTNLEWALGRQMANGWFADCDNTLRRNDRPITHTIAYTLDGALGCANLTGEEGPAQAARTAAKALLDRQRPDGALQGRYDREWHGSELPIVTGCAQMALVWAALYERDRDAHWRDGALRAVAWTTAVQGLSHGGPRAIHGAVPGSFPLWGRYEKFAFPNWALKYHTDALLVADRMLDDTPLDAVPGEA